MLFRIFLPAAVLFSSGAASLGCYYGYPDPGGVGGAASVAGAGGSVSVASSTGGTMTGCGLTPVSFNSTVKPILNSCIGNGACHQNSHTKWMTMSASGCGSRKVIEPGHPESSYMLHKLTGMNLCAGEPMPKAAPPLPPDQIQLISDWICQGALFN